MAATRFPITPEATVLTLRSILNGAPVLYVESTPSRSSSAMTWHWCRCNRCSTATRP
jgi:hypothetical protein